MVVAVGGATGEGVVRRKGDQFPGGSVTPGTMWGKTRDAAVCTSMLQAPTRLTHGWTVNPDVRRSSRVSRGGRPPPFPFALQIFFLPDRNLRPRRAPELVWNFAGQAQISPFAS